MLLSYYSLKGAVSAMLHPTAVPSWPDTLGPDPLDTAVWAVADVCIAARASEIWASATATALPVAPA